VMRRGLLIIAAGLAILVGAPLAAAIPLQGTAPATVHVTPGTGGPLTTFRLTLRNPTQTGTINTLERFDAVTVSGPSRAGCVGTGRMTLPVAAAGQIIRVALSPARMGNGQVRTWCAGTFHGIVVQITRFMCGPPLLCPELEVQPQTVARFSFRVARRS